MPNNNYYEDVKVIKKPFKSRLKNFIIFCLVIVTIAGVIAISFGFSEVLTISNFDNVILLGRSKVDIKQNNMYAVILEEFDNEDDAKTYASKAIVMGASGYIWKDEKFYVIGNFYFDLDSANSVVDNIKTEDLKPFVKEINYPKLKIEVEDKNTKNEIERIFKYIDELSRVIYNNIIKYDKKEINNFAISSALSDYRAICKSHIAKFQNLIKNNSKYQKIQDSLIKIDELLNNAMLKVIDKSITGHVTKYSFAKLLNIKYNLYQSII